MLQVWFGAAADNVLYYADSWFNAKGFRYLGTKFSRGLIKNIDKCTYIADKVVDSEILGVISSKMLSTGSKTIMMLKYSDYPVDANWIGDNLMSYVRNIGLEKDIVIISGFFFKIYSTYDMIYPIKILNTGRVVHDSGEFYEEYIKAIPEKGDYDNYPLYSCDDIGG